MMIVNKYLQKAASWKNPSKFVGYVTGSAKRNAGAKVKHMEEAIANKLSLRDLKRNEAYVSEQTTKARMAAGGAAATAVAGGAYGYKKVRDAQQKKTIEQYNLLLKAANVRAAKELAGSASSGALGILKRIGRTTVDVMNTAGGGKIKDHAVSKGLKYGTKGYSNFVKSTPREQMRILSKAPGANRKQVIQDVGNLHKQKRDAQLALTTGGAAAVSAYGWHKSRQALKNREGRQYY